jgi:hypothetical protein
MGIRDRPIYPGSPCHRKRKTEIAIGSGEVWVEIDGPRTEDAQQEYQRRTDRTKPLRIWNRPSA